MNIAEILKQAGLPEESLKQIEEAFNEHVEQKLSERLDLEVKNALEVQDKDHKSILTQVFEAAETKRKTEVAVIEKKAIAGVKQLVEKHQKELTEKAAAFRGELEEQISDFIDEQLAAVIPNNVLEEAAQNNNARKILARIREIASLDDTLVKENVRKAIMEGKAIVDKQAKQLAATERRAIIAESALLIERKTGRFPAEKKQYFASMFKNKTPKFITENFEHAEKMYARNEQKDTEQLAARARTRDSQTKGVDHPVITESTTEKDEENQQIDESASDPFGYMNALRENW